MSPDSVNGGIRARQVQRLGWVPDLPDARDYMYSAPDTVLTKMPKKVDLRGRNMPKVYDQGELGSCTANAIGAAFEFGQVKQGLKDFMPSRLFIYYNERAMEGTIDTDSGAMIRDGMKSVNKIGVCTEVTWPYDIPRFTEKPPKTAYTEAKKHQAQGCLAQGYPFVFGFAVYESFMSPDVAKTGQVPLPPRGEQLIGGHAVLAVGYDDSINSFIVRNSWGQKWGMKCYCTMPYGYLTDPQLSRDFWAIYTVEPEVEAPKRRRRRTTKRLRSAGGARRRGRRRQVHGSGQRPPNADRGRGVRPGAFAGDRLDLPALPPAEQAEGLLDGVGPDLLSRSPRRNGAAARHRVRSGAHRADRAPHTRR